MRIIKIVILGIVLTMVFTAVYVVADREGVKNLVKVRRLLRQKTVTVKDLEQIFGTALETKVSPDRKKHTLRYRAPRLLGGSFTATVRTDIDRIEEITIGSTVLRRFAPEMPAR
jgi:hypothetical protein